MAPAIGIGIGTSFVGGAPFSPTDIDGAVLWLRADLGVTEAGTGVSSWADQSGNGNDFSQGDDAKRPSFVASVANLGGLPAFDFNGSSDEIQLADASELGALNDTTVFWVVDPDTTTGFRYILRGGTSTLAIVYHRATSNFTAYHDGTAQRGDTVAVDTPQVYALVLDSAAGEGQFRKGGATMGAALTYDATWDLGTAALMTIGSGNGSSWFNGRIAEVVIYDRVLGASELASVEGYLLTRYGL